MYESARNVDSEQRGFFRKYIIASKLIQVDIKLFPLVFPGEVAKKLTLCRIKYSNQAESVVDAQFKHLTSNTLIQIQVHQRSEFGSNKRIEGCYKPIAARFGTLWVAWWPP